MNAFKAAHAAAEDWAHAAQACLGALGPPPEGANLGFLYATDLLAEDLGAILQYLKQKTGILDWVGGVGIGICGAGAESFDRPALAVMVGALPPGSFRLFPALSASVDQLSEDDADWIAATGPVAGIVHGCPENPATATLLTDLAEATGAFLTGGVTSSRWAASQIAGRITGGGVSGLLLGPGAPVATAMTRGCLPLGPEHVISDCLDNVIIGLDGRRASAVLAEDLGTRFRDDPAAAARRVLAALPVEGSDVGDHLVRDLVAIDSQRGWLALACPVRPGDRLMFVERNAAAARADMARAFGRLRERLSGPPRGGVYVSCLSRGPGLFGHLGEEIALVRQTVGEVPLVGFFGHGEIANARLHGYTGVLTLFT